MSSDEGERRCMYYECKEAQDPRERGPYEVSKGCVTLRITSKNELNP